MKHNKLVSYIKRNYDDLPKSRFDEEECVVVRENEHSDYGHGHHTYEGVGVTKEGNIVWCYSSGCSCNGTVNMEHEHKTTAKVLQTEIDLSTLDPKEIDFASLQVNFDSY